MGSGQPIRRISCQKERPMTGFGGRPLVAGLENIPLPFYVDGLIQGILLLCLCGFLGYAYVVSWG